MSGNYILEVSKLTKTYGIKKAVSDISFKVEKGDIFGFLGPNGAGKTTTIKMILKLIHANEGNIKIDGYDIKNEFMSAIKSVGAVVETPKFYSYMSGYNNLKLIANLHKDISKNRIDEVLEIVGLTKRAKDKVKTYSLGMKQRLGIARALLNSPKLVILDEPTNGLDPQGIKEIREMISQLALEQDITFFISSHLLHEVEQMCNKVAILKEGEIKAQGSFKELLDKKHETVEICSPDTDRLFEILKRINYAEYLESTSKGLKVTLEKGCSGKLNRLLISENIMVDYLIPNNQSLEEYFISVTEGGTQIA